ncbi:MAG: hypothetical protein JNK02_13865 [Planctomycetes bacterium]|nr:hypothetical protein [Planctomycetota bacterium]
MSQAPQDEPFSEAHLESPEYRERLMRKLNCLIAVLEVATAKVRQSMALPEADQERLGRIRSNLQSTLDVCLRARVALERREGLPRSLSNELAQAVQDEAAFLGELPRRHLTRAKPPLEISSEAERAKFERLAPIRRNELRQVDLELLMRQLQGLG